MRGASGDGPPALTGLSGVLTNPRMAEELSLNAIVELCPRSPSIVSLTILNRLLGWGTPSTMRLPPKNQWRECSLLDWPMSKSSTLVGSRPMSSLKSVR